jgi:hypothetical protein
MFVPESAFSYSNDAGQIMSGASEQTKLLPANTQKFLTLKDVIIMLNL